MRWNKNPVCFGSLRSVPRESSSNFTIQDFDLEGDEDILVSVPIWLSLCVVDDDNDGDRENEKERVCVCVCVYVCIELGTGRYFPHHPSLLNPTGTV